MVAPYLIIGIGNEYRGDDGVGLVVVRTLQVLQCTLIALANVTFVECSGDGTELLELWATNRNVIIIDAVSSGQPAGTILRLGIQAQHIPLACTFNSTHTFGLAEALGMARVLHELPSSLVVYAIEGRQFAPGNSLSPEVEQAIDDVIWYIIKEIEGGLAALHLSEKASPAT